MNAEQLNAIKERAEKASPGPWGYAADGSLHSKTTHHYVEYTPVKKAEIVRKYVDTEFIIHAREDIPQLVAEVERLRNIIGYVTTLDFPLMTKIKGADYVNETTEQIRREAFGEEESE